VQNDIKKVLAYSTVSQLGYMILAVGVGAFGAGVFHLMTHAFFKACLFLGAGSVIHAMAGEQDLRQMGGLRKKMPWTHATFLASTLAIAGVPLLSGFFSKDEILYNALALHHEAEPLPGLHVVWFAMALAAALMTAIYMFRLYFLTFSGDLRSHAAHPHESPASMTLPLVVLAIGAVGAGYVGLPVEELDVWHHWLEPVFAGAAGHFVEGGSTGLEFGLMGVSSLVALAGIGLAWWLYRGAGRAVPARLATSFGGFYRLLLDKYRVDEAYDVAIVRPLIAGSRGLWRWLDAGLIDGVLVNGSAAVVRRAGGGVRLAANGDMQAYAAALLLGLAVLAWVVL
jgi:NADH-quinone oxidoreductase subunit L